MGHVVSAERVAVLRWQRGTGYYGAHKHEQPYSWEEFQHNMPGELQSIQKSRYESYILSWLLFHKQELNPDRLDMKHGATILNKVRKAVENELEYRKAWMPAKPKAKAKT